MTSSKFKTLFAGFPQPGQLRWIGLRPARGAPPLCPAGAEVDAQGLAGDRYAGRRAVTLIQWEHLPLIADWLGLATLDPALLRRNLVVSGINLLALRDCSFRIGSVLLRGTGACHPCSKMELALGTGGFNAMRGHGGITAEVVRGGYLQIGDSVRAILDTEAVLNTKDAEPDAAQPPGTHG